MSEIEFSSEMSITLVDYMPRETSADLRIVNAARLSLDVEHSEFNDADEKLIRSLINNQHGTPFEKVRFEFLVEVPIWVAREWFKQRFSSFNEVSGRYTEYKPKFYIPSDENVRHQVGKKMSYDYETVEDEKLRAEFRTAQEYFAKLQWEGYKEYLNRGIARELARFHIGGFMYTKFMWGIDLRSLTNFLVLRNSPQAMLEIRRAASVVEECFEKVAPITYRIWKEEGRPRLAALDN